ncbi:MAG TPA: uroporphyrinogen-III C-methyltransferase [Aquabacterium sp.]|nr:uroporphyrinogen-III C-methyltransferase [Aquabacterium sp.]HQC95613.1 uroporphyrinogen-III C-methyltransferase [Aquabacterium sp.]
MNDTAATPDTPVADTAAAPAPAAAAAPRATGSTPFWIGTAVLGALAMVAITLALIGQQRIKALEQELVRRQQDSQGQAIEARALAQQAQDLARAAEGKVALLEGRVAETALQRTQLEELIQQLSRSRDENVLADVDAAVRVAVQQSAITGSAEPLAAALRQSEERLSRMNQPRLERVRRALARDLERVRAVAVSDVASLTIKLDEAIRSVDDMPLLAQPDPRPAAAPRPGSAAAPRAAAPASAASAPLALPGMAWWTWLQAQAAWAGEQIWSEVRGLVRVTRIANPEAVLVAPDQAWFLRENLKLRLLNARLALLSRQYDTAQADLRDAVATLERYFDRSVRRVVLSTDLLRQVAGQARQLNLPRPDETLAALSAAQAGR